MTFVLAWLLLASPFLLPMYLRRLHENRLDIRDPKTDDIYLVRWHLFSSKYLRLYLHNIRRPDADRNMHNHPWSWGCALVLRGGYTELGTQAGKWWCRDVRWLSRRPFYLDSFHRIMDVLPGTWTLFMAGPYVRDWGFRQEGGQVVPWREYLGLPPETELGDK